LNFGSFRGSFLDCLNFGERIFSGKTDGDDSLVTGVLLMNYLFYF